jgi:putative membrane protein
MMVSNQGNTLNLLRWQRENATFYAFAAAWTVVAHDVRGVLGVLPDWQFPAVPVAVVGGAIGIFASFRTNSAYQRWWEGRQLWGRMINTSRHFSTQVLNWIGPKDREIAEDLVRGQIAYVHLLRCLLRVQDPWADPKVRAWLSAEQLGDLPSRSNPTHALLHVQHGRFTSFADAGGLDGWRLQALDESVRQLLDIQGGCERIKKTPLPRGYAFVLEQLIKAYAFLLALVLVHDLHLFAIPMTVLVCLAFALISEAGRVLEDPFTMFWNGLALTAMSATIENDLRSRMGHTGLDPLPVPDENGILM